MSAVPRNPNKLLGEQLIERGIITREQLWEALRVQSRSGELLGSLLVKMGLVSEEVLSEFLDVRHNQLDTFDPVLLKTLPEQFIRKHKVIPLKKEGGLLTVAMADPTNVLAIDDLRLLMGCDIEPVHAGLKDIEAVIQKHLGFPEVGKIVDDLDLQGGRQDPGAGKMKEEVLAKAPVARLVNSIFVQAMEQNASDVHIEPQETRVRVRYRVDGMLREVMTFPKRLSSAVVSRIKIMSDLDIAEKRTPQDGRIYFKIGSRRFDIRISSLPTVQGEKIVARLLGRRGMESYNLEQIGFEQGNLRKFTNALKSTHGLILITGPTGSGKTTTLYASLNRMNNVGKNITTVEDPVEYTLEEINQTQVNSKAGMTFGTGLRAILRQDPDIIMVGEIRDRETAEIATRAAITGHLVLSTLHTNDAAGAITRLVDMGIEPFMVASSVLTVVAQRLVRLICPDCRTAFEMSPNDPERSIIGADPEGPLILYKGAGCENCGNTGYRGRMAIHEVLPVTKGIRNLIVGNAPSDEIKRKAMEEGMVSLTMDGIQKAMNGLTTIEEVLRVSHTGEIE